MSENQSLCFSYQLLQFFCRMLPAGWSWSPCVQGHMWTGTHWPWPSCASPSGHWHPGTQFTPPSSPSQLQPRHRSAQDAPHGRPHSWYTCPPEHCTAAGEEINALSILLILNQSTLISAHISSQLSCATLTFNTIIYINKHWYCFKNIYYYILC